LSQLLADKIMTNPFVFTADEYMRDLDPTKHAVEQYTTYLQIQTGKSEDVCKAFVTSTLQKNGQFEFKDKKIKIARRDETGDRALEDTTVLSYIAEVKKRKLILAPTWTAYKSTQEHESFLAKNIDTNIKLRNVAKKSLLTLSKSKVIEK
jgi:hypothetical protein